MLELIRYGLALVVAETHLWTMGPSASGWQSVFAFYTLSGYLMTRVLHERYGFSIAGTIGFLVNRILRLWPAYLIVISATALAMRFLPLQNFFFSLVPLNTFVDKLTNMTIVGQVGFDFIYLIPLPRLAPTSWSLSIEVFCYCLLAFYFARTRRRLMVLAAIGVILMLMSTGQCWLRPSPYYGPYCFQNRYGVLQAGFVPFAAGGLTYFYRPALRQWLQRRWQWVLASLLGAEPFALFNTLTSVTIGPFLGVIGMTTVLALHNSKPSSRLADFLGRSSYHLFISHMSIAAILVVGLAWSANSFSLFAASSVIALALSCFLVPLEWRLNRLRGRISAWALLPSRGSFAIAPATLPERGD